MKRNTTRLFSGLTIILCLMVAFALTVAAQTGLSKDQVKIGETVNVSLDVPTGAWVTAWSCTPYGALSFSATTNTGTTYKTVATAVKPGEITVRATVKYADNTTSTVTVGTLLTVLEDGIYTVGNDYADDYYSQSGAFYLRSQITYPTSSGLFVAQHSQNNFGDITNRIYNYWYIEHQGSGQYTIRSVADENKALTYSGSTFSLSTIGSNVTTAAKWYIKGENIIPVSATTKCLILSSAAPEGTYHTDGNAYTYFNLHVNGIGGIAIENWSFEKENISGVIFKKNNSEEFKTTFTKSYHIDTDTVNFSELGYSIKTYHQSGPSATTITWSSSKTSVATVNSSTGKLTICGAGRTTITVEAVFAGQTETASASYEIAVIIDEGAYFLKNIRTELYCGIEGGIQVNGNEIEQQAFDGDVSQKWVLNNINSNIYTINLLGAPSFYLGVENDSATEGADIVLRTGNVTNGMKWRLEEGNSGYKFISCLDSNERLVLMTNSNNAAGGEKLVLGKYTNDTNHRDEWHLTPIYEYLHMFIGRREGDLLMPGFRERAVKAFSEDALMIGYAYDFYEVFPEYDFTKAKLEELLREVSIFTCLTHGEIDRINLLDDEVLTVNDIEQMSASDIEDLRFVYLGACLTGNGGESANNLVNAFANKGVDIVIGFTVAVVDNETNKWTEYFLNRIANGQTVERAMQGADDDMFNDQTFGGRENYTTTNRHHCGNINTIICPQY